MATQLLLPIGERLLTKKQLADRVKLSSRSIDRKIAEGSFPRGIRIGRSDSGAIRWRESLIDEWIAGGCQRVDQ